MTQGMTVDYDMVKSALNAAYLIIAWFIRRELVEIKEDGKANRLMNEATAAGQQTRTGICEERHRRLDEENRRRDLELAHLRQRKEEDHR